MTLHTSEVPFELLSRGHGLMLSLEVLSTDIELVLAFCIDFDLSVSAFTDRLEEPVRSVLDMTLLRVNLATRLLDCSAFTLTKSRSCVVLFVSDR